MIDSLRGNPVIKDVATLIQNIQQKLPTTVSVEVLQKILNTKDGYKYLANIDGTLTEMIAKQDLQNGVKYWADGIKNQTTNMLVLDNLVQKPQLLQNEIFKNEVLSNILGFDKLVEAVADELAHTTTSAPQSTPQSSTQNTQNTPAQQSTTTSEPAPNMNSKEVIRLSAADSDLAKSTQTQAQTQSTQATPQKLQETKADNAKAENTKTDSPQPQKTAEPAQKNEVITAKQSIADAKENVAKELKEIVKQVKDGAQTTEQPKVQSAQTSETPKQTKTEQVAQNPKLAEQPKTNDTKEPQAVETTKQKEAAKKEELKEKLASFKNLAESPTPPTKAELEKAKISVKEEIKSAAQNEAKAQAVDSAKAEVSERIAVSLAQNFDMLPKSMVDDAVKKLTDLIFGKFTPQETDETINKIMEHLQKQAEQKAEKDGDKGIGKTATAKGETIEESKPENAKTGTTDVTQTEDRTKSESSPASKIKAQILEELAKTGGKTEFGILSNVAMALNKEVFTFVLPEKGILQFRKKKNGQKQKELNAKTVEFYSAFETLGPVSGEITHIEGEGTNLSLNVEFESTYRFLKETLDQLSFFDKKNVSITHGIKEIVEIKSSFLDTIG